MLFFYDESKTCNRLCLPFNTSEQAAPTVCFSVFCRWFWNVRRFSSSFHCYSQRFRFLSGGQWTFPLSKSKINKIEAFMRRRWSGCTLRLFLFIQIFFSNFVSNKIEQSKFAFRIKSECYVEWTYNLNWYHLRYVLLINDNYSSIIMVDAAGISTNCTLSIIIGSWRNVIPPSFDSTCKFILTFIIFSQRFESCGPSTGEFFKAHEHFLSPQTTPV